MNTFKDRYISELINEMCFADTPKMAFVVGPRQTGKTTIAKNMLNKRGCGKYYNWDQREFRRLWAKTPQKLVSEIRPHSSSHPLIIFDEIHKSKLWKRTLKGIFDTLEEPVDIIVTGSARLDTYKKGSDSLLGRYFIFHLHPFSVAELLNHSTPEPNKFINELKQGLTSKIQAYEVVESLMRFGGFPEPFFSQSERRARAWRQTRLQQLVREDIRDFSSLQDLGNIELLLSLLPERVASQLSRPALREDLEVAYTTVSRWLHYLSAVFYHFEIKPYHKSIRRSLKKEGKLYLWDYSEIVGEGQKFENLVAQHLLKTCHFWTDTGYGKFELMYLRNADSAEIDFLVVRDGKPWLPVEAKIGEKKPSLHWRVFLPLLPCNYAVQLIFQKEPYAASHEIAGKNVLVLDAGRFLSALA
jgi:hypothetical protein